MDAEDSLEPRHATNAARSQTPWRCGLLVSVVVLNYYLFVFTGTKMLPISEGQKEFVVCLPSLVLSYGTVLAYNTEQGVPEWISLLCPTVLTVTFCLTQCWCREAADSWGAAGGHRIMAAAGLTLVFIGVAACAGVPALYHPLLYGVLGGLGTSLVSSQVDAVVFDTYDTQLGLVRGLYYAGQAIGQFLLPHVYLMFLECYGSFMFYLVLSALVLQTLPAVMCLKVIQSMKSPVSKKRFSDQSNKYTLFSNDLVATTSYNNDLQLYDLSKKNWMSPSDDNIRRDGFIAYGDGIINSEISEITATITPPSSPEEKRKNIFGVEILPEIAEESEVSCSSDAESENESTTKVKNKYIQTAIKRLSAMSDNFEDYICKVNGRRFSENYDNDELKYTEIEVTVTNVPPMSEVEHEDILNSFSFRCSLAFASLKRTVRIPSYRLYRIRRRFRFCMYSLNDTFIKPLSRSLRCWRFYPALLLCFSKLSLALITSALIPLFSLRTFPNLSLLENNFLISLHAFTWLCFLLNTPWIANISKRNYKYITVAGLIMSTTSLFVIGGAVSHDAMAIGCVFEGFGFGAIVSTWETAARDFVGVRQWSKIQSTLETLSATCVALLVVGFTFLVSMEDGLKLCVMALMALQGATSAVWFVLSVVSFYKTRIF